MSNVLYRLSSVYLRPRTTSHLMPDPTSEYFSASLHSPPQPDPADRSFLPVPPTPSFSFTTQSRIFPLCPLTLPCLFALVVLAAASPSLSLPVSYLGVELGLENRLEGKRKTCYTSVLGGGVVLTWDRLTAGMFSNCCKDSLWPLPPPIFC